MESLNNCFVKISFSVVNFFFSIAIISQFWMFLLLKYKGTSVFKTVIFITASREEVQNLSKLLQTVSDLKIDNPIRPGKRQVQGKTGKFIRLGQASCKSRIKNIYFRPELIVLNQVAYLEYKQEEPLLFRLKFHISGSVQVN